MAEVENILSKFQLIPVSQIQPSRHQARKYFDEQALNGLAESIKQEGLQNPITVRPVDGGFELIAGERRLRATKLLGLEMIEAKVVEPASEAAAAAKGLVENLQKQDLDAMEEAEGFSQLNKLDGGYWTMKKIGEIAGKSEAYVSKSISLLDLPESVQDDLRRRKFTREHGIELLRLNNANSIKGILNKMTKGGGVWPVKKLREAIDKKLGMLSKPTTAKPENGEADPLADYWSALMQAPEFAGRWKVGYKGGAWSFQVKNPGQEAAVFLSAWFEGVASVLKVIKENPPQA